MINIKNLINNTSDKLVTYANSKYALFILIVVSFTESSFFIIPPDFFLFAMAMAIPSRALFFAFITTIFSVLGGLFGYLLGYLFFDIFFLDYISSKETYLMAFNKFKELYNSHSFLAIFIIGFTPIPYKIGTIASGALHTNLVYFVVASFLSRGLRFFLLAFLIKYFHKSGKELIIKYFKKTIVILSMIIFVIFIGYIVVQYYY